MSKKSESPGNAVAVRSRRDFLLRAGTMAGGLMALDLTGLFRDHPSGALMQTYASANYALELDGIPAGWLHSFDGGSARGDVILEPSGANPLAKKHLGNVRYDSITIGCGTGSKSVLDWIRSFLSGKIHRRNGAVVLADHNYKVIERLEFQGAMITEVGFPALGGAVKEPFRFTVKFAPEFTRRIAVSGAPVNQPASSKQPGPSVSNFRLKIQGLEQDCAYTQRIEPLTIRQKISVDSVGQARDYQQAPGKIEYSNLAFTVARTHAESIMKWHEDFVVKGNNGDAQERPGLVELLSPDLKTVLFTVSFGNLGVIATAPVPVTAAETVRNVKVEMYFEWMDIAEGPVGSSATQGGPTSTAPAKGIPPPPGGVPAKSAPLQGAPGILPSAPLQRQAPKR